MEVAGHFFGDGVSPHRAQFRHRQRCHLFGHTGVLGAHQDLPAGGQRRRLQMLGSAIESSEGPTVPTPVPANVGIRWERPKSVWNIRDNKSLSVAERTYMSHVDKGKVIAACGIIDPSVLGRVMMHEHLHSDLWDWERDELIKEEKPATAERRRYLLDNAVPHLTRAREDYGMAAYCDATMPPWRCWPDLYREVSKASGVQIVIATGFYREIEVGTYYVKTPEDAIWPFVRQSPVAALTEMCIREVQEGIHGTDIRAGCIKLGTSQPEMTETEKKTFAQDLEHSKRREST